MDAIFNFFDQLLPQLLYTLTYYFLGFLLLLTGLLLITTSSSVHGILYLLLIFLLLTEIAIFLKMEFLGLIFVIIYIGAVCVLMLFHIKLIKTFVHRNNEIHNRNLFLPCITLCLFLPLIQIVTLALEHKVILNEKIKKFNLNNEIYLKQKEINKSTETDLMWTNFKNINVSDLENIKNFSDFGLKIDKETFFDFLYETAEKRTAIDIYYETLELMRINFLNENDVLKKNIDTIYFSDFTVWVDLLESSNTTKILGILIFTLFFFHLILGSLILLLTMISTITLSLTEQREKKKQNLSDQIFIKIKTIFQKKK